jgi:hypothetical protein
MDIAQLAGWERPPMKRLSARVARLPPHIMRVSPVQRAGEINLNAGSQQRDE